MYFQLFCAYFYLLSAIKGSGSLGLNQKTWDYTIISVFANSSNENLLKWDVKVERIGRGEFGISGTFDVKVDYGDDQETEIKAYRSATGGSQYEELPFKVKRQPLKEFMNKTYRNFVMEMFATCSDFPQVKENEMPWFEIKTYTLNKCKFSTDNLPSYMVPGYYKLHMISYGVVDNLFEMVVQIEKKG